jgi:hypothetical protein
MLSELFIFQNCCDTLPHSTPSHKLLADLFEIQSLQKMKICGPVYSFHSLNNLFWGLDFSVMSYYMTWGLLPNALRQHGASIFKGLNVQQILEDETIMLSQNDTNHSVMRCHIPGVWKPLLHCSDSLKTINFWVRPAVVNTCFNNYRHTVRFWVLIAVLLKM